MYQYSMFKWSRWTFIYAFKKHAADQQKQEKKSPKNCYNKTPLVFCKNINAKIHKTLKNSTKIYINT